MKTCRICKEDLSTTEFFKHATAKDRLFAACKICERARRKVIRGENKSNIAARGRVYYKKNRERILKEQRAYYRENKEARLIQCKAYNRENKEKLRISARLWRQNNKARKNANTMQYIATKLKATPTWVDEEELFLIKEAYALAQLRFKTTGVRWHVDHIVPLRSKEVCGLHTINNLQVITAVENQAKGNKLTLCREFN